MNGNFHEILRSTHIPPSSFKKVTTVITHMTSRALICMF